MDTVDTDTGDTVDTSRPGQVAERSEGPGQSRLQLISAATWCSLSLRVNTNVNQGLEAAGAGAGLAAMPVSSAPWSRARCQAQAHQEVAASHCACAANSWEAAEAAGGCWRWRWWPQLRNNTFSTRLRLRRRGPVSSCHAAPDSLLAPTTTVQPEQLPEPELAAAPRVRHLGRGAGGGLAR